MLDTPNFSIRFYHAHIPNSIRAIYNISFNNEIGELALKWIFARGNRTGRSAYQFFKEYCSEKKIKI